MFGARAQGVGRRERQENHPSGPVTLERFINPQDPDGQPGLIGRKPDLGLTDQLADHDEVGLVGQLGVGEPGPHGGGIGRRADQRQGERLPLLKVPGGQNGPRLEMDGGGDDLIALASPAVKEPKPHEACTDQQQRHRLWGGGGPGSWVGASNVMLSYASPPGSRV